MTFLQQPALRGPRLPSFLRIRNLSARAQARRTNPDSSLSIVQAPELHEDSRFRERGLCDSAHADDHLGPSPADLKASKITGWCSGAPKLAVEGNLDLGVTARGRGSNGGSNAVGMLPDAGPPGATRQNDEGDAAHSQVLLVADSTVGRDQQLEPRLLGGGQERAIAECVPALCLRRVDRVAGQRADQPLRRAVVKEDEHRRGPRRRAGSEPRTRARPSLARASRQTARSPPRR
jgi:hypothetical protein